MNNHVLKFRVMRTDVELGPTMWVALALFAILGYPLFNNIILCALWSILLFATILVHELGHVSVARHYGFQCRRIRLHYFGGAAMLDGLGSRPRELAAIVFGTPATHLPMAGVWFLLYSLTHWDFALTMAAVNLVLMAFNLLPIGILDGGRLLRALLWAVTKSWVRATQITSALGVLGGLYLFIGVFIDLPYNPGLFIGLPLAVISLAEFATAGQSRPPDRRRPTKILPMFGTDTARAVVPPQPNRGMPRPTEYWPWQ